MRPVPVVLSIGTCLAFLALGIGGSSNLAQTERGPKTVSGTGPGDLVIVTGPETDNRQLIVLFDQRQKCLCSYQIDLTSGQISLRCVRNVEGDLLMDDFNGTDPSPEKIRAMFQDR